MLEISVPSVAITKEEKENRVSSAQDLFDCVEEDENLLKILITADLL